MGISLTNGGSLILYVKLRSLHQGFTKITATETKVNMVGVGARYCTLY